MKHYVGIDLGTTNSVICTYDGDETRIWKSPEQNDVTPSAIFMNRRGNKYIGRRAYDSAPYSRDNAALQFKRTMGTSTPIKFDALDLTMTPEECSAEILRTLVGYLPEEARGDSETGTVITVPAAFDQMKKNATKQAAELAGIGRIALIQEPVAAVMSAMRTRELDGTFLIYDLGGGTFDAALAESIGGRVNLLANHGISYCGGSDFDRFLFENLVKPWLFENFDLPENVFSDPRFKSLRHLALWAAERAKIELSSRDDTAIILSETETRVQDQSGHDIYFEIPLTRDIFDKTIEAAIEETIDAARETLSQAGVGPHDVERIVFVGGPTNYKPLRDRVSSELAIRANTDINPMTAVAEGAALFAESVEWSAEGSRRKSSRGQISSRDQLNVTFNYTARTPELRAKVVVQVDGPVMDGSEFQVDSLDTGWTSGRLPLRDGTPLDLVLSANGENIFRVFVFDAGGNPVALDSDKIVIVRTAATVDAIPASQSIGIAVLENGGKRPVMAWLVRAGDKLPSRKNLALKTVESLKAGSTDSLNFKLYEGESDEPDDNRDIGVLKVAGTDFDDGVIAAGAELQCAFEMADSGNIVLNVSIPSIAASFSRWDFYSAQEGKVDFSEEAETGRTVAMAERTLQRLNEIASVVADARLDRRRNDLESVINLDSEDVDADRRNEAREAVEETRKLLVKLRKQNLGAIRRKELDGVVEFFNDHARKHARPSEDTAFSNLTETARRSLDRNNRDFESQLDGLKHKIAEILWRQDWYAIGYFKQMASAPHLFSDRGRFSELIAAGMNHLQRDDIDSLRQVIHELGQIQISTGPDDVIHDIVNIARG